MQEKKQQIIKEIMGNIKKKEFLTFDEFIAMLEGIDLSPDEIELLYIELDSVGVEFIDKDPESQKKERPSWLGDNINDVIDTFSPRVAEILRFRWGLDGRWVRDRELVSKKFGITTDRIRRMEAELFKRQRGQRCACAGIFKRKKLLEFLDD